MVISWAFGRDIRLIVGTVKAEKKPLCLSRGEVQSTLTLNNWARYVDKINRQDQS